MASMQLRSHPAPSWTASQRDPFLLLGAALAALMGPAVANLGLASSALEHVQWSSAMVAAVLGAGAFLIMVRDLTPGRAVDALYRSAIVATAVGLLAWVAAQRLFPPDVTELGPTVTLLGPALLDLAVVCLALHVLHLRTRARTGSWLMLMAWVLVLAADGSRLLTELTGGSLARGAARRARGSWPSGSSGPPPCTRTPRRRPRPCSRRSTGSRPHRSGSSGPPSCSGPPSSGSDCTSRGPPSSSSRSRRASPCSSSPTWFAWCKAGPSSSTAPTTTS